jgi:light-regulated signal transduction histidine kinase (bacteriophytochrome)
MRGVLGDVGGDVDLELRDGSIGFYDRNAARAVADAPENRRRIVPVDVAGRRWTLSYAVFGDPLSRPERVAPWAILVGGMLISILAAALLRSSAGARRRAQRLVAERTRELQRSNEELEHFAYLASHDLQEPLRTITAYVGLLEQRVGDQLDERSSTWMRFVGDGADRMSRLIRDLLEYSRAGRHAEPSERLDLGEVWDAAVANLESAIDASGATVERGELPVVRASRTEMTSLLQNLLANALKYRADAPPEVRADAERRNGTWEIRVADNGMGIDPRFHDRIFGLFQRLHTTDEYPGTGMGLAIVRKLAESNGGSVRVESRPGGGSAFVVCLPTEDA